MKKLTSEDIACILAILIGGSYALLYPEQMDDAFRNTIVAVILIKIFW